jgi:hypothetical protein
MVADLLLPLLLLPPTCSVIVGGKKKHGPCATKLKVRIIFVWGCVLLRIGVQIIGVRPKHWEAIPSSWRADAENRHSRFV